MDNYSETILRARIKTVMEGVTGVGQVHDYQRWLADWESLRDLFSVKVSGITSIKGWMISLETMNQESETFMGGGTGNILVSYQYLVRGFLGVDDSEATEKTMAALALDISKALSEDATLLSYALDQESPTVRIGVFSYRMFAGILAHYSELRILLQEVL